MGAENTKATGNKVVIITGANGNLGSTTVKKFIDEGYYVVAVDGKSNHLAFAEGSAAFEFHSINLTSEAETAAFTGAVIAKHGTVHAALMLVGGFAMGNIDATSSADIQHMFSLNFDTAYNIARPLLANMRQSGYGRLVFVGARPALQPADGKNMVAYSLTKSLLFKLADLINAETKGTNVVASVIAPSTIDTALNRQSMPTANFDNWVKPESIADVLEFICSEKGSTLRESVYKLYNNA